MNKDWGSLEVLLVLCCLVGSVAFICCSVGLLSLSMATTAESMTNPNEIKKEQNHLNAEKAEKERALSAVEREIQDLEKEVADKKRRLRDLMGEGSMPQIKAEEYSRITAEAGRLDRAIEKAQRELARSKQHAQMATEKQVAEEELRKLQKDLDGLKRDIEERQKTLVQMQMLFDDALSRDEQKLKREIKELERQIGDLRNQLAQKKEDANTFNPGRDLKGRVNLNNPLFVECKSETISIYPGGRTYSSADLKGNNPFTSLRSQHDGVAFLIRPDGFGMFNEGMEMAERSGFKNLCYEPVDANWKIDFSR